MLSNYHSVKNCTLFIGETYELFSFFFFVFFSSFPFIARKNTHTHTQTRQVKGRKVEN